MIDEIENKRIRIRDYLSGDLDNQEKQDFQEWLERDLEAQRLFREQVKQYHQMRWAENWDRLDDYKAFDLAHATGSQASLTSDNFKIRGCDCSGFNNRFRDLAMETAEGAGNVSYDCGYHDTPGECSGVDIG
ncbi:MAG: hypothetical protein ACLUDU_21210 [Butyricimonas faecihominis]